MKILDKQSILEADDLPTESVEVPEWGGAVRVRTMTGAERDAWEQSVFTGDNDNPNLTNGRARLVAMCAIDAEGKRLFTEADAVKLGAKSARALDRVATVAQRLNRLTDGDVEDLGKN